MVLQTNKLKSLINKLQPKLRTLWRH